MNREIKFRAWNKRNKKMYYKVMVGMWVCRHMEWYDNRWRI